MKQSSSYSTDLSLSSSNSHSSSMDSSYNHYSQYPSNAPGTPVSRRQRQQIQKLAARYGTSPPQQQPPKRTEPQQVALPLPKNLVLLELMEAAEKRNQHSLATFAHLNGSPSTSLIDDSDHSGPEMDEEHVLNSIDILSSTCGTYVVKDRCGLAVHSLSAASINFQDEGMDIDLFISSSSFESGSHLGRSGSSKKGKWRGPNRSKSYGSGSNTMNMLPSKPTRMLVYGQKVQIVEVKNGVYRLARNQGLIFAEPMQLVKVGTPQEQSCKVEGMVRAIETTKSEISQKMEDLAFTESNLRSELDQLLSRPESQPVISAPPRERQYPDTGSQSSSRDYEMMHHDAKQMGRSTPSDKFLSSSYSGDSQIQDSHFFPTSFISDESIGTSTPTPATPPTLASPRSRKILFEDTANAVIDTDNDDGDVDGSPFRNVLMCGVQSTLIPLFRKLDSVDDEGDDDRNDRSRLPIRRMDSDDTSLQGRNSTFESVDFRTGFSGHVGMNQARKARRNFPMQSQIRMMGDHRGIARINKMREKPGNPSSPINDKKSW